MDVSIYPGNRCEDSPTKAHYFSLLEGSIWRCKYCWRPKWAPTAWEDANRYSDKIKRIGVSRAYKYFVVNNPRVHKLLEQFEEIRLLRQALPDKEFEKAVVALLAEGSHTFAVVKEVMSKQAQNHQFE